MIYEGGQAWEHYRHVENERNSYLVFFFTVSLASVALIVTLPLWAGCVISCAAASLGLLVYWSVERFRYILKFYDGLIIEIREALAGGAGEEAEGFVQRAYVRQHLPLGVTSRLTGPQAAAEVSSGAATAAFALLPVGSLVSLAWVSDYPSGERAAVVATAVYSVLLVVTAARHAVTVRSTRRVARGTPGREG